MTTDRIISAAIRLESGAANTVDGALLPVGS